MSKLPKRQNAKTAKPAETAETAETPKHSFGMVSA